MTAGSGAEPPFSSILTNLKKLKGEDMARPLTDVNLDNVQSTDDFRKAMGTVPFGRGVEGSDVQFRIAWVLGTIISYFIRRYGTIYDPALDTDTTAPPLDSYANYGNDELFIGDKHLPRDVAPKHRIMGMVPEDINRVYHFFIQIRKPFNKPNGKPLAQPNKTTNTSFSPIFLFPNNVIEEKEHVGPIAQQLRVDVMNTLTAKMCGQFTSKADIDMFVSMANKDKNGLIKLRGGGSGGMLEVKGPPIPDEKKAILWDAIIKTNAKYQVWSARDARTEELRRKGAALAKEQMAITEAADATIEAEASRLRHVSDLDYTKESKIKGAPMYDEETLEQIQTVNRTRDETHRHICESSDELNKLKLISNSEHVTTASFFDAVQEVGGIVNMPDGFDESSAPEHWPTVTFGDIKLKVHQVVGLHALFKLLSLEDRSAVCADDVGTGKTILILALLSLVNRHIGIGLIQAGYGEFDCLTIWPHGEDSNISPSGQMTMKTTFKIMLTLSTQHSQVQYLTRVYLTLTA